MSNLYDLFSRIARRMSADRSGVPMGRRRLVLDDTASPIYAIGDVHGRLDLLISMETRIADDASRGGHIPTTILLGDVIDRGPHSAQVIDHIIARQEASRNYHCLAGNHEESMLRILSGPVRTETWLTNGGLETLMSYGVHDVRAGNWQDLRQVLEAVVPEEHRKFLEGLPSAAQSPAYFFCHAGIRPELALEAQLDADLLWRRDGMAADYSGLTKTVVHGHQPMDRVTLLPMRINIDTGAYASGRLSAVKLVPGAAPLVFEVSANADAGLAIAD